MIVRSHKFPVLVILRERRVSGDRDQAARDVQRDPPVGGRYSGTDKHLQHVSREADDRVHAFVRIGWNHEPTV